MISFVENLSDSTKQLLLAVGAGLFIGAGFYIVWTTRSKTEALTNGTQKFEHQTAGHEGSLLKSGRDKLMKPASKNEVLFYTQIYKNHSEIQRFAPKFYGTLQRDDLTYIVLEDLTARYKKPCIMDIKMGLSSVGEDATPEKKARMKAKDDATTTSTLGMRICGLRVYSKKTKEYIVKDKAWGKKVRDETMKDSIALYFSDGENIQKHIVEAFLKQLRVISEWMDNQSDFRFYSSSLLFLYEGEHNGGDPKAIVKMIDFAHVHPITDGGKDEGYIIGLKNTIRILESLLS